MKYCVAAQKSQEECKLILENYIFYSRQKNGKINLIKKLLRKIKQQEVAEIKNSSSLFLFSLCEAFNKWKSSCRQRKYFNMVAHEYSKEKEK